MSSATYVTTFLAVSALGLAGYAVYSGGEAQRALDALQAQYQAENSAQDQIQNQAQDHTLTSEQLSALQDMTDTLSDRVLELESSATGAFTDRVRSALLDDPGMVFAAVDAYEEQQIAAQAALYQDQLSADAYTPVLGNPDGDITLVEFFDYNCSYCRTAMDDVLNLVADDGNIRLVLKELPILSIESQDAALVALAAADLVDYLALHRAAMSSPGQVDAPLMLRIAEELGADMDALNAELDDDQANLMSALLNTHEVAQALGIKGTPAFYLEGTLIPGAIDRSDLEARIADLREERANQG